MRASWRSQAVLLLICSQDVRELTARNHQRLSRFLRRNEWVPAREGLLGPAERDKSCLR
jgi:hypothetical protein